MNIWKWITETARELRDAGDPDARRLADIIDTIPRCTIDDEHARVDAAALEGVALARRLKLPWVEVFLRHWQLQSRVFGRREGESVLADAVALVDFAHEDAHRDCPQSVCTVQDLGSAYGNVDGVGYAPERRAVSEETLARITVDWPCFICISSEYAAALLDGGDAEGALAFMESQLDRRRAAGHAVPGHEFALTRSDCFRELGRYEEALEQAVLYAESGEKDGNAQVAQAYCLALLGRFEESGKIMPPFEVVDASAAHYPNWAATMEAVVAATPSRNTTELGEVLEGWTVRLIDRGSWSAAFSLAAAHGRLAFLRRSTVGVRSAHAHLLAIAKKLRPLPTLEKPRTRPLRERDEVDATIAKAAANLQTLREQIATTYPMVSAKDALATLDARDEANEWTSADERLSFLDAAVSTLAAEDHSPLSSGERPDAPLSSGERPDAPLSSGERPDAPLLTARLGQALVMAGYMDHARTYLEPLAGPVGLGKAGAVAREAFAAILRHGGDRTAAEAWSKTLLQDPVTAHDGLFFLALFDYDRAQKSGPGATERAHFAAARSGFEALFARERGDGPLPFPLDAFRLAASAARRTGDAATAVRFLDFALAEFAKDDPRAHRHHWERLIAATQAADWRTARNSAAALEIPLQGGADDPIAEEWEVCLASLGVAFEPEDDDTDAAEQKERQILALRTGPATVRVLSVAPPQYYSYFGATLLIRPEKSTSDEHDLAIYPALRVLSHPEVVRFPIDGVYPGEEAWRALRQGIQAFHVDDIALPFPCELWSHSGESYLLPGENGEQRRGIFASLAFPAAEQKAAQETFIRALCTHMKTATQGLELAWPELAEAAGDTEEAARQTALAVKLGCIDPEESEDPPSED